MLIGGHILTSHIYENGDNTFNIIDASKDITVDTYNSDTLQLISSGREPMELENFGGFYSGENYNYIVYTQTNADEDDNKEVLRVVKYDKQFNILGAVTVKNCYTINPCRSGSLRMDEEGDLLFVHTSRLRYKTDDGLNHQSQLSVIINTTSMTVCNDLGRFQANHVSHSFNQFVKFDGDTAVLIDHGDAYPRAVVMNKYINGRYIEIPLMTIPGSIGANCTGITVGGLEISNNNYIIAINSIDHSKATSYDSFNIYGLTKDERDVRLLICDKNNTLESGVKQINLTSYVNNNKLASTPYIVSLPENEYMILWEEFDYGYSTYNVTDNGVKYVKIDENGNMLTEIKSFANGCLSYDCQPVLIDDKIIWYLNDADARIFYSISTLPAETSKFSYYTSGNFVHIVPKGTIKNITHNAQLIFGVYDGGEFIGSSVIRPNRTEDTINIGDVTVMLKPNTANLIVKAFMWSTDGECTPLDDASEISETEAADVAE